MVFWLVKYDIGLNYMLNVDNDITARFLNGMLLTASSPGAVCHDDFRFITAADNVGLTWRGPE
jgi:hypothetical protein